MRKLGFPATGDVTKDTLDTLLTAYAKKDELPIVSVKPDVMSNTMIGGSEELFKGIGITVDSYGFSGYAFGSYILMTNGKGEGKYVVITLTADSATRLRVFAYQPNSARKPTASHKWDVNITPDDIQEHPHIPGAFAYALDVSSLSFEEKVLWTFGSTSRTIAKVNGLGYNAHPYEIVGVEITARAQVYHSVNVSVGYVLPTNKTMNSAGSRLLVFLFFYGLSYLM
jgi:hypothetical protein